jgi:hypothetical protein
MVKSIKRVPRRTRRSGSPRRARFIVSCINAAATAAAVAAALIEAIKH